MKIIHSIITCFVMMLLASCDSGLSQEILHKHNNEALTVTSMKFSDDYGKIFLHVNKTKDLGSIDITDTSKVKVKITDSFCHLIPFIKVGQPKLNNIKYITPEQIKNSGLTVLTLIDLSQPDAVLKKQKEYVKKLHTLFPYKNLYISFMMPYGKVSSIMQATDYIINNYITSNSPLLADSNNSNLNIDIDDAESLSAAGQKKHAYLFRSVTSMLYNISGHAGTVFDNAQSKALIIFSDGQVYDEADNMPLDPQHFVVQEKLINISRNLPTNTSVYYVNLASANINNAVKDTNMMRMLCMRSNGKLFTEFNWISLQNEIFRAFSIPKDDYVIEMDNPKGKIFFGSLRNLRIKIYVKNTDKLIAECNKEYRIGNINTPIIVGESSYMPIYISGIFIAFLVISLSYIILQFVIPYVKYRIFRRKYVVKYTGQNMSVEGNLVADTCYFCKAPFEVGDTIVAKCQHTMHEECWQENDQHCPEYGKNCPEGSHYYDSENLFNPRNGSYLIKWVIPAIFVSAMAWIVMATSSHEFAQTTTDNICDALRATNVTAIDTDTDTVPTGILSISPRMYMLTLFGLYLLPFLTLLFSGLASYHRQWKYRLADMVVRAFLVAVLSVPVFFTEFLVVLISDLYDGSFIFDWIPWIIVTYIVIYASTARTRIHDLHSRTAILVSLTMGAWNALVWNLLGTYETKNQIILFVLFFFVYSIVLAVTIARKLPLSEKYFLHVNGEVKEMDIALYKWLKQSPDAFVTIGRSVDCQLQISWDTTSDIAPLHAIIRHKAGVPYITSADGEVFIDGKPIIEGKKVRLHHGMSFQIGSTTFTFLES